MATVIAGFFTGGALAIRGGMKAARNSAIGCAILLGVIEGVGIGIQRMMAENTRLDVRSQTFLGPPNSRKMLKIANEFSCRLHLHHPHLRLQKDHRVRCMLNTVHMGRRSIRTGTFNLITFTPLYPPHGSKTWASQLPTVTAGRNCSLASLRNGNEYLHQHGVPLGSCIYSISGPPKRLDYDGVTQHNKMDILRDRDSAFMKLWLTLTKSMNTT